MDYHLWGNEYDTTITYYKPDIKRSRAAVIIFPGGAYLGRSPKEGDTYARLLNDWGITAFVLNYSVYPARFPTQLIEARRAVRYIRDKAKEFGISKDEILAMGSSAGGHLVALLCNYHEVVEKTFDEIDICEYLPNGQILCYPVISSEESITHKESYENLLGDRYKDKNTYSPELLVNEKTPKAFIWHTAEDRGVNVANTLRYVEALSRHNVACEAHIFPEGNHGLGLAECFPYVSQWTLLLKNWFELYGYLNTEDMIEVKHK